MFAVRPGTDTAALPIAIGSHLDTQPIGGKFDGILGVLAGLEVLRTLRDNDHETHRPLMLVNWTNEEGPRFAPAMLGSAVYAGVFDRAFADSCEDDDGIRFAEAIETIGYCGTTPIGQPRFAAMFELHIEQGPMLERGNIDIGIVTGVQAMRWYDLTITGREAHAGTTPMDMRVDALADAARLILAAQKLASEMGGLATTGQLGIVAASRNVVPGKVTMSLDLRHEQDEWLDVMEKQMRALIAEAMRWAGDARSRLAKPGNSLRQELPPGDPRGRASAGASMSEIVSGAGHDSVNISKIVPTAMIFVPCREGLSHNPQEFASQSQCALGAQTLLNAVLLYDKSQGM